MARILVSEALLLALHESTILCKYNCPAPMLGSYGWLSTRKLLELDLQRLSVEPFSGFYAGPYKGLPGSPKGSGFCSMGALSYSYSPMPEGLTVGRYVSISAGLTVLDSTHPIHTLTSSNITFRPRNKLFQSFRTPQLEAFSAGFDARGGKPYPVIGHDVWIGAHVTLAMGISVGTGAVIASGSIVTHDVPPYAIVAGSPAQVRRSRFAPELVQRLLASRWWTLDPQAIFSQAFDQPQRLVDWLDREGDALAPFAPPVFDFRPYALDSASTPPPAPADTCEPAMLGAA